MTPAAADRLADAMARTFETGDWVGVSPRGAFARFTGAEAAARPAPGVHTAWELLLHLDLWHDAARRRLAGETAEYDCDAAEDWPSMPPAATDPAAAADAAWADARARLDASYAALVAAARAFPPSRLGETVPGKAFTYGEMLGGTGAHALYHAAQALVVRRMLDAA